MAWIEKRGPRYRVVWREGGERVGIVCTTKTEARAVKAQIEADLHRGTYINPRAGQITVKEWAELWIEARPGLKRSTESTDRARLTKHIVGPLGALRLEQVTPLVVRRWTADLEDKMAAKTVRNCHGLLYSLLQAAVEERVIPRNPCVRTGLPMVPKAEMHFLTVEEIDRLITATPKHYRPLIVTLVTTGLRWGEAAGLRWRSLDLDACTLTVRETLSEVGGRLDDETPKSSSSVRTVSLARPTVDALNELAAGAANELVFMTSRGTPLRRHNFGRRVFKPALQVAELPETVRIHDLRHTHVAHLISAGVPLPAISRRLGHASIKVTVDVYGHLLPEVDERLLTAVEGMLAPAVPTLAVAGDRRPEAV